ncbi:MULTISPECIES: hypothetical protein [Streptomyces]|uniref:hypothetical protein n=1 Tax=Streptomyces TaxID=1883 RepID=UPI0029A04856|nr:hypothetical protein [Streptomyces sp. ND04-05B]MDX3060992.1 hypothetical protein [Streptomyces sp. ND04-05B]
MRYTPWASSVSCCGRTRSTNRTHWGWADTSCRTEAVDQDAGLGIDVEVTRRESRQKGFEGIPRRRVVERTTAWLMNDRRPAGDYETHPHCSEATIHLAMAALTSRGLTREPTRNRRNS